MPIRNAPPRRRLPALLAMAAVAILTLSACQTTGDGSGSGGGANTASYGALMRLADNTRTQGDLYTASTLYRRAHAADVKRVEPLLALGAVLVDMGNPREALDAWRQALALDARNPAARRGYGRALIALDQPQEAARQYTDALALDPKDIDALNGLGVARDMMGDHQGAQERFRAALALRPDDAGTQNNLGFSHVLSGDTAQAIAILEPLAQSAQAGPLVRQNLAFAYGMAGRDEDAARMGRLDLDEAGVQRNLAYYRQARLAAGGAAKPQPVVQEPGSAKPMETAELPRAAAVPAVGRAPLPIAEQRPAVPSPTPIPASTHAALPAAVPAVPATGGGSTQAPPLAAGGVRVELDAFASEALAREEWDWLSKTAAPLVAGRQPLFVPVQRAKDGRTLVHLRLAFADAAEAGRFCTAFRSKKRECTVLRASGEPSA